MPDIESATNIARVSPESTLKELSLTVDFGKPLSTQDFYQYIALARVNSVFAQDVLRAWCSEPPKRFEILEEAEAWDTAVSTLATVAVICVLRGTQGTEQSHFMADLERLIFTLGDFFKRDTKILSQCTTWRRKISGIFPWGHFASDGDVFPAETAPHLLVFKGIYSAMQMMILRKDIAQDVPEACWRILRLCKNSLQDHNGRV